MVASAEVPWDVCEQCAKEDGKGVRLPGASLCWAHAADTDLDPALKRLSEDGHLDARGVPIAEELWRRLVTAAPQDDHGHTVLTDAQFDEATFQGTVGFERATFQGDARFDRAAFQGDARFGGVTFQGIAWFDKATFQGGAGFDKATFQGGAWFDKATFQRIAGFIEATFQDTVVFGGAAFQGGAWFNGVTFQGGAGFDGVSFYGEAVFDKAAFQRIAGFGGAAFYRTAWFGGAAFQRDAGFGGAAFQRDAGFTGAAFQGDARFDGAAFQHDARFDGVTFQGDAGFDRATFQQAREVGPMLVRKSLLLDRAVFHDRAQLEVAAAMVCCRGGRFLAGVQLRVRWAQVVLDDADLAAPAILTGVPAFEGLEDDPLARWWPDGPGGPPRAPGQPWVASLCRADIAGLAIANADLQACRFAGAHNLDRLRLESPKAFTATPGLKAVATGWAWPPVWWWTRRQTLAEEHAWRAAHERGIRRAGWRADQTWPAATTTTRWVPNPPRPAWDPGRLERHIARAVHDRHRLRRRLALAWRIGAVRAGQERARRRQAARMRQQQAREVANLYRALRKAREDVKDEPGAADFYYGEMELRRHAAPPFSVERAVLTLYWLVAGYALRAWRAFAALTMILVLAAWLLAYHHGLAAPQVMSFWGALRYSGRTAIGLLPRDQPALTPWGDVVQIAVRVVVPVLLGLAVLSIRGRVKR
jgi:uncharacterized protein YjbI with pentapeptide repeats